VFEFANFENLKGLNLSNNRIMFINVLEIAKLSNLKELDLHYNEIVNIALFEKNIFKKLEYLDLTMNKIDKNDKRSILKKLKKKVKEFFI
jgi:Leucine-rich repeat (LRR) protein